VEKQYRFHLGQLPVAYKSDLDSNLVYIMDGAVTTFSNQNARRGVGHAAANGRLGCSLVVVLHARHTHARMPSRTRFANSRRRLHGAASYQ
jgi:hypothetical protein